MGTDIFYIYGEGIQTYFNLIWKLVVLFAIMTIFSIPMMVINWNGKKNEPTYFLNGFLTKTTMGDLGHADHFCNF